MALLAVRREPTVFAANAVRTGRVAVSGRDGAPVVPDRPLSRLAPAATFVEGRAGWERGMAGKKAEDAQAKAGAGDAAKLIDAKIAALGGWRGEMLARLRDLIRAADPGVVEEVKWRKPSNPAGVPVWSHAGILCTGETYRDKVKLTFAKGALLDDPSCLFNASLDGNIRRAIDIGENATIDETALTALIHAAVALNTARRSPSRKKILTGRETGMTGGLGGQALLPQAFSIYRSAEIYMDFIQARSPGSAASRDMENSRSSRRLTGAVFLIRLPVPAQPSLEGAAA